MSTSNASSNNNNNNIDPATGRCTLHPGIQLLLLNRKAEWRTLLKACPLCVSGLPPTAVASAVAAARSVNNNNNNRMMESNDRSREDDVDDDEEVGSSSYNHGEQNIRDDLDARILLKKQQKKILNKKKHQDDYFNNINNNKQQHSSTNSYSSSEQQQQLNHDKSPRSRPRSPSPQSPYKVRQHLSVSTMAINGDDHDDYTTFHNDLARKLFVQKNHGGMAPPLSSTLPTSSLSSQQQQQQQQHCRDGDLIDRMNRDAFRQFVERDRERHHLKEGREQYRMEQGGGGGGGGKDPPPDEYHNSYNNNYFVQGGRQQQRQQQQLSYDDRKGSYSAGSHHSSSSHSRCQSEVCDGSQHSYSHSQSRHAREEQVSDVVVDDETGSYYSAEEECTDDDENSGSNTYPEDQSLGAGNYRVGEMDNSYTPSSTREHSPSPSHSQHVHYQQQLHQQQQQQQQQQQRHMQQQKNEWTSPRHQQHAHGSISQHHQQWSSPPPQQQQQYQSFHHRAPPQTRTPQNNVRPDPEDYTAFHPHRPSPQLSAAERMMRHNQVKTSPPPPPQQASPYPPTTQSRYQTQFESQEDDGSDNDNYDDDDDDDDDDDNEREVLEPEEVSIISMNSSASRNLMRAKQMKENKQKSLEVDSQKHEQGSQKDPGDDDTPIKTYEYDHKGRCVRHPTYQLRKKKVFKGWVTLMSNCPECCLDEMRRVKKKYEEQQVSSPGGGGSSSVSNSVSSSVKKTKKKKKQSSQHPPITQLRVSSRGSGVDDNSSETASTFTNTSSFTNTSGRWQNYLSSNTSVASAPPTTLRVTRLPYNDQYNEKGWYTGQVSMAGLPHGWGTMNYANGHTFEGEWRNGVSVTPSKAREAPAVLLGGGEGGGNFYSPPPHHHHQSHQLHLSPQEHRRGGSVSGPPVSRRQLTQLEPLREDPLASSLHSKNKFDPPQSRIVSGMPYRDNRGCVIGVYTGEVDERNVPNGIGSMRYNSGLVSEGRWIDGELHDGYNVTDDEDSCGNVPDARSVPGVRGYHNDGYHHDSNNTSSYPGQNLQSKLSGLEEKLSTFDFNNSASGNWR